MDAVNYSDFTSNVKKYFDMTYDNHEPIIVTREEGKNVVIVSSSEYNALTETLHLLSNKANNQYLFTSIDQIEKGRVVEKKIEDLKKWK